MSAREQPMAIILTTAGTLREGIFDRKYAECERILNGYFDPKGYHDDRVLPVVYELDKRNEWRDPHCWIKANPGLGTIKKLDILAGKVEKAKADPLQVKNLLVKDFDVRETSTETWLTFEQLNNQDTFELDELRPNYGLAGCDLSTTTDLTAAVVIFMLPDSPTVYVLSMYWLPEDVIEQREANDNVPYSQWRDMGLLRVTPGNKVDYRFIVEWFEELRVGHGLYIYSLGYDAWSAEYFVQELRDLYGKQTPEAVHQGKKTLSAPMKIMAADLECKLINYNNNPIMKWCLSNVSIDIDKNDNIQPCKLDARKRIDGAAALLDAYVQLERHRSDYIALL
ncbi:MAG: terminase TerL endonuclease subunit [Cloacibacillus sp.]